MKQVNPVLKDERKLRIRFSETDPMGIVWHGNYIRYFEDGRESFGARYGIGYLDFYENGLLAPIVKVSCNYRKPVRYGEEVIVETSYVFTESAKLEFNYRILSGSTGEAVTTGQSTQVFTDNAGKLFLVRPPFYENWLRTHGFIG